MSEDLDLDAEILAAQRELEALEKEAGGSIDAEILAAQKELDSLNGGQTDIDEEIRRAELELQKLERERAEEAKKEQEKRRTIELKRTETETQRLAEVQKKKDDLRRRIEDEERARKQQQKEEEERRVVIARKIEEERKKKLEQQAKAQTEQRSKLEEDKRKYEEMQKARAATLSNSATATNAATSSKEPVRITTGQPAKKIDETEIERLQNEMIQQRRSLLMEKYIDDYFSEESVIETAPDVTPDVSFKVIVIGDSGVGKSNMLNRWIKGCFGSETIIATTQCAFHQKTFKMKAQDAADKDRIVAVRLWDTAGQERFLSLTRQFFRGAVGVVVVYDTTARESFTHVQKWLNAVEEEVSDTNMILIGNKTDLVHSREVDKSEGIQWATKNNMSFLETSALDGSNCSRALQILLQDIYERHLTKKSLVNSSDGAHAESEAASTSLNASGGQVLSNGDEEKSECAC